MPAKRPSHPKEPRRTTKAQPRSGRPTEYTPEIGERICLAVSTGTKGLKSICAEDEALPRQQAIYEMLARHPDFAGNYAQAKARQMELMEEELIEIADDASRDTIETETGEAPNTEWLARSRLRVDTRKWLMSKLAPKKYGDRLDLNHSGEIRQHLTLEQYRERVALAISRTKAVTDSAA